MKSHVFHPRFQKDLDDALRHYGKVGGSRVADRFFEIVQKEVHQILAHPRLYHFDHSGLRRANLSKFPYHILFFEALQTIAFQVLKHDHRHPNFGLRRKF